MRDAKSFLAILLPCVFFWMDKKLVSGLICLGLQITLVGWIPAALWAFTVLKKSRKQAANPELGEIG